jgi:hypothetical protein
MSDEAAERDVSNDELELYAENPTMFRNHPLAFVLSWVVIVAGVV